MPVIWYGDGTMDFIVLWSNGKGGDLEWTCHDGVWWLRAPSKMTRKSTYPEIIRYFVSRDHEVEAYIDDAAKGHGGTVPDNLLRSLHKPCVRVQIQGGCTVYKVSQKYTTPARQ